MHFSAWVKWGVVWAVAVSRKNMLKEKLSNWLELCELSAALIFNLMIGHCFQRGVKGRSRCTRALRSAAWEVCVCVRVLVFVCAGVGKLSTLATSIISPPVHWDIPGAHWSLLDPVTLSVCLSHWHTLIPTPHTHTHTSIPRLQARKHRQMIYIYTLTLIHTHMHISTYLVFMGTVTRSNGFNPDCIPSSKHTNSLSQRSHKIKETMDGAANWLQTNFSFENIIYWL